MTLSQVALDQRRADMMHALYVNSGRTCGTYSGLWEQFCRDVGANLRDADWAELRDKCIRAIGGTQSCMADHHAEVCIAVIRAELIKNWE